MSQLRHIILLSLCSLMLVPCMAQRRYEASEQHEYALSSKRGFSTKDVENQTDVLWGLHASLYSGSHHLIGFSLEGSWSSMTTSMPNVSITPGGWSGGFHLLYEYQYSGFLLQTGIGANYQRVTNALADATIYHENMPDQWSSTDGATYCLKHTFNGRQDMSQQLYGRVPLYVGHYIFGSQGIGYVLGGLQAGYAFWGNTRQTMTCSTTGLYERYVGIWEEMDNHGFRKDVPIERTGKQLKLSVDLLAHLEIGYEYNTRQGARDYRTRPSDRLDGRIRIGAFADFGILNTCPQTKEVLYDIPESTIYDFPTYQMAHVFSTQDANKYWVRNLFVGIRVTVLFGFQPKEHCILCDPWRH